MYRTLQDSLFRSCLKKLYRVELCVLLSSGSAGGLQT